MSALSKPTAGSFRSQRHVCHRHGSVPSGERLYLPSMGIRDAVRGSQAAQDEDSAAARLAPGNVGGARQPVVESERKSSVPAALWSRWPRSRPDGRVAWRPVTGPDVPSVAVALEPLLSIEEVSRLLRISESGVYRLVRRGELPRVKVGSRTLFEVDEVRRFIALQRVASSPVAAPLTTTQEA